MLTIANEEGKKELKYHWFTLLMRIAVGLIAEQC
jgi:hypothetical protein